MASSSFSDFDEDEIHEIEKVEKKKGTRKKKMTRMRPLTETSKPTLKPGMAQVFFFLCFASQERAVAKIFSSLQINCFLLVDCFKRLKISRPISTVTCAQEKNNFYVHLSSIFFLSGDWPENLLRKDFSGLDGRQLRILLGMRS